MAEQSIRNQRNALVPDSSSVSISQKVWSGELNREMDKLIIRDVREHLETIDGGCSVCYMIAGVEDRSHESGARCPRAPLKEDNEDWLAFKRDLRFPKGIICFGCLLPTVRVSERLDLTRH